MYSQLPNFPYGFPAASYPYGMQSTLRYTPPPPYYSYPPQIPSYMPQQYYPQPPSYYPPLSYIAPPVGPQNLRNSYFPQPAQRTQPQQQVNYTSRMISSPQAQNQVQTLQSPQKQKGLTYEEVMQRIAEQQKKSTTPSTKLAPQAPPQQESQIQPSQTKPKETVPQTQKTTQPKQQKPQPQKSAPKPQPEQRPATDDLDKRFAEAIQRTKQIVHQINKGQDNDDQKLAQRKAEPEAPVPQEEVESEELDELALQYEDGFIYRGHGYQPATRHGYGVLTDAEDNVVYEGSWANNVYDGEGKLNNLQQDQLEGPVDWNNMSSIGNGWANYEGSFQQGKMHGYGQLVLTNGEKYLGEFIEGMIEGQGEFYTQTGEVVKGFWQNGILNQE